MDPPQATSAEAGPPHLDEDFLVLSTIHSAKGQEWDVVFVLNVTDGCIPSDMAVGTREQIEEERRLLYVAMTRARQHLHLVQPLRFFRTHQHRYADAIFWRYAAASFQTAFSISSNAVPIAAVVTIRQRNLYRRSGSMWRRG
jgi:DNA helicase II / ATP-dependent DNA helicase PcrA